MRVTVADMKACRFCNAGARAFCSRHGINWTLFIQEGIEVDQLDHIDDAMLAQVIEQARRREEGETK